jgi:hypothetical protein
MRKIQRPSTRPREKKKKGPRRPRAEYKRQPSSEHACITSEPLCQGCRRSLRSAAPHTHASNPSVSRSTRTKARENTQGANNSRRNGHKQTTQRIIDPRRVSIRRDLSCLCAGCSGRSRRRLRRPNARGISRAGQSLRGGSDGRIERERYLREGDGNRHRIGGSCGVLPLFGRGSGLWRRFTTAEGRLTPAVKLFRESSGNYSMFCERKRRQCTG